MNIQEINKRHYFQTDMYYRVGKGVSSELLAFKNGIIFLKVIMNQRWKKSYRETALELARCWKNANPELADAFGCKVFVVDTRKNPYKNVMMNFEMTVDYDTCLGLIFGEEQLN